LFLPRYLLIGKLREILFKLFVMGNPGPIIPRVKIAILEETEGIIREK
jgi:hypothetical protein